VFLLGVVEAEVALALGGVLGEGKRGKGQEEEKQEARHGRGVHEWTSANVIRQKWEQKETKGTKGVEQEVAEETERSAGEGTEGSKGSKGWGEGSRF
jgi:hypothetical protein